MIQLILWSLALSSTSPSCCPTSRTPSPTGLIDGTLPWSPTCSRCPDGKLVILTFKLVISAFFIRKRVIMVYRDTNIAEWRNCYSLVIERLELSRLSILIVPLTNRVALSNKVLLSRVAPTSPAFIQSTAQFHLVISLVHLYYSTLYSALCLL